MKKVEYSECLELMRQAFVAGAAYWEYESTQFTMWKSDKDKAYGASVTRCKNLLQKHYRNQKQEDR